MGQKSVADPGFPRGGGANSGGASAYEYFHFHVFSAKILSNNRLVNPGSATKKPLFSNFDVDISLLI